MDENLLQQLLQPYIDDGYKGLNLELIKKKLIQNHQEQEDLKLNPPEYPWSGRNVRNKSKGVFLANFKPIKSTSEVDEKGFKEVT